MIASASGEDVTLLVAAITPLIAGAVAIVIHRQRLAHERREADLTIVRELLTRGAMLLRELDDDTHGWMVSVGPGAQAQMGEQSESFARFRRTQFAWRDYTYGDLCVMFDPAEIVRTSADEIVSVAAELARQGIKWAETHPPDTPMDPEALRAAGAVMTRILDATERWRDAATAVGRRRS